MELRDWNIEHHYSGSVILNGKIYNDEKGRFRDGTFVRTPRLRSVDFEKGVAKTKNSTYLLK